MDYSKFIDAYTDSGGTLREVATHADLDIFCCMFAGMETPPTECPITDTDETEETVVGKPECVAVYKKQDDENTYYYAGTGCQPIPNRPFIAFTKSDWTALLGKFEQCKGGDPEKGPPEDSPTAVKTAEETEQGLTSQADQLAQPIASGLADLGFPDKTPNATRDFFRQLFGLGRQGAARRAAREKAGMPDADPSEKMADAVIMGGAMSRIEAIVGKLKGGEVDVTESDKEFMRKCLRLRGGGVQQGVYILPGDDCGSDFAALGAAYTKGGDRYGMKIGNQNSGIFAAAEWLHEQSLLSGTPLYEVDAKGKPKAAIFWGSTNAAKMHSYRAMHGRLNEWGPKLAQAWIKCKRQKPCKKLDGLINEMVAEEQLNLNLLIYGAEERNAGVIPHSSQFADVDDEGNELILNDIQAVDGNVDGAKALAWVVGSMINSWDAIVSDEALEGCEYDVVGRGRTGHQPDGTRVNQDNQISCAGAEEKVIVNRKQHVKNGTGPFGGDAQKDRSHLDGDLVSDDATGLNIKLSEDGDTVQYGNTGCATVDAVVYDGEGQPSFAPANQNSRDRHANYLFGLGQNYGQRLEPEGGCSKSDDECAQEWREEVDDYKLKEVKTVNGLMAAIEGNAGSTVDAVLKDVESRLGYEEGKMFVDLRKQIEEYKNLPPGPKRTAAYNKINVTLTNGYRNKNQNTPGFRGNLALEYAQTSMATQNQIFAITKPAGGKAYLGTEGDGPGGAVAKIMGFGQEEPAKIKSVHATGISLEGGIQLRRRIKEGYQKQEALEDVDEVTDRLRELSGDAAANTGDSEVGSSAMKAEDFVRQLQELIKGIDKVLTVQA